MAHQLQGWLQAVADIGSAVNQGVTLKSLLNVIAKTACELMHYDFCAITLPDNDARALLIEGSHGLSDDYIQDVNATHPIRLHGISNPAPSTQAFSLGVAVQVADTRTNPSFGPWGGIAQDQGFVSMIAVPLNASGSTLGTLNCYTRISHTFSAEEESLLTMLADQAAIAITTARLRTSQAKTIVDLHQLNESLEDQYELQRQGAEVHERLTSIALGGGGVPAVAEALSELLDRPVAVRGVAGNLLHSAASPRDQLPSQLTHEHAVGIAEILGQEPEGTGVTEVRLPTPEGATTVLCTPVMIKDDVVAWIWTTGAAEGLAPLDRRTVEHAATVMALELLRIRTAAETAWRHSGEILSGLLSGAGRGSTALVAQAASLGHDLSQAHAVIVSRFDSGADGPMQFRMASTFMRLSQSTSPKPLLGMYDGYAVALWPLGGKPLESAKTVSEDLRKQLTGGTVVSGAGVSVIAGPVDEPSGYPETFITARGAVEYANLGGSSGSTLVLTDLGMSGLFLQIPDVSRLRSYADTVLQPLRDYDEAHNTELLHTLTVLIRNDLDARRSAEQMFIHKNTVVQRRRRIEDLLGIELTSVATLARIVTALDLEGVIQAQQL